ncbi:MULTISPECIES: pseudouridine-5'-phosphate glycosidase [unclassified Lentimicrobium]|uniref:pseudouridine-5'-phosphate glycosidase n=1 Tax=unclassified Lentimicrobium TaxID=2677434 RepID=UPI001556328F|nr:MULTISPECIES: pseudouridine-5'-phosphate glycosidase [unclassified Lentimicrobium]NPD47811.1 pseudouridine-5'-phosphate glycosidase [Lentimicrobium sp. S6]NPD86067.1 pseudouridine-5'-phosphate glycosidase [Lentimicrobium sp. L6]
MIEQYLDIHPEIAEAIKNNKPVVALESTIISHGMPYPQNVETARRVESIIRERGAFPATICIIDGRLKVGLSEEELEFLGTAKDVAKVSRRDLPFIVAKKLNGATTVATTMIIAEMAGIEVFVTGGIGGVHRGAEENFDISADLTELSQTNVAVVCAGAKSILDLGLTLEYLETQGVPVIGYQTDELPAFYTRQSGFDLLHRSDSAKELASIVNTKFALNLQGGVVIANPIPEEYAMDYNLITEAIETALQEADKQNVKGKDITPFLLSYIKEITKGKSLESNIQLVYNNARLGADLAVEMKK